MVDCAPIFDRHEIISTTFPTLQSYFTLCLFDNLTICMYFCIRQMIIRTTNSFYCMHSRVFFRCISSVWPEMTSMLHKINKQTISFYFKINQSRNSEQLIQRRASFVLTPFAKSAPIARINEKTGTSMVREQRLHRKEWSFFRLFNIGHFG